VSFVFLMTDVVGSTSMWERFPAEMPEILSRHDQLVHGEVERRGGTVFKHTGDGMIAVFRDPDEAVDAANAALAALDTADWPPLDALQVRCSIHAGAANERDGDYFGPALNRVARINGVANPGQVLASDAARHLMRQPMGIDLGEHQLRDLGRPLRLWQIDGSDHPPLVTLHTSLHNLPVQLTDFIGRQREIRQLTDLIDMHRLVTLTGVGGCGKTRLALEVAATISPQFPGGVWFVDLRSAGDHDQVLQEIARSIGLITGGDANSGSELEGLIVEYLNRKPTLLILDNCEHLVDDAAELAEDLAHRAVTLTLLATSREALGVEGERVWRIPSLETENGEARELFLARAMAANAEFTLRDGEAAIVDEICSRLDGIPLAIELAAARVNHLSLADLNDRLDERFSLLSGGRRARRQRQQTLQAMMDWSWDLLSPDERQMLPELAVFRGGFDPRGVEEVCTSPERGTRFEVLTSLVDRSLVAVADDGSSSRYQLLETVRLYALDRLTARGDTVMVRDRHAEWVRGFNSCRRTVNFRPAEVLYTKNNADNVIAVLEWLASKNDLISVAEIAGGRAGLFDGERNIEGRRWLDDRILSEPSLPYDVRVGVHFAAAQVALFAAHYERWQRITAAGMALIDTAEPGRDEAVSSWEAHLCLLAAMAELGSGSANELYDRAVSLWPRGETESVLFAITAFQIALTERDLPRMLDVTELTQEELDNTASSAYAVKAMSHATALSELGRHSEAVDLAELCASTRGLGDMVNAMGLLGMAMVHLRAGDTQRALDALRDPPAGAVGEGLGHWLHARALLLAQILLEADPEGAARLIGCVQVKLMVSARATRTLLLEKLETRLGESLDPLLEEGSRLGYHAVVGGAQELLRSQGLDP